MEIEEGELRKISEAPKDGTYIVGIYEDQRENDIIRWTNETK